MADGLQPIVSRVRTENTAIKLPDGSRWTDEPLTHARLLEHVGGGLARGVCPMKRGETTTRLALFDLDSHKGATPWDEMRDVGRKLRDHLETWDIEVIAFRSSGGRGMHLFVLWNEPQDAYSVREAMAGHLAAIGFAEGAGGVASRQIEVFPKQNEISAGGFGNQFILPLAGKSVPLDTDMMPLPREAIIGMSWPTSAPVAKLDRPPLSFTTYGNPDPIDKVRRAALAIPNDGSHTEMDYDWWFRQVCAIHEALGGSADAFAVAVEFSERNPVFKRDFFEQRVWPYLGPRDGAVTRTRASLYEEADRHSTDWRNVPNSAEGFDDLPVEQNPLPAFARRTPSGVIKPTITNLLAACRRADVCGFRLGRDRFKDEVMLALPNTDEWRPFTDADYTWLRDHLARIGFAEIAKESIRDAVHAIADEHSFDSAILWLESLQWDGVKRVGTFLSAYAGALDTPYTRAVSSYLWTALAGRVLSPGCQADMSPVLVGAQGVRKSSLVKAMVPSIEHYTEIDLRAKDDDLSRRMRGRLVAELGELQGMGSREVESVKAFITRCYENWVPKFKEFQTLFPRRLVFVGTTNKDQFLSDETGNRRWLPVRVETMCDPDAVARDRLQLWAEAAALFRAGGVRYQEAERLGQHEHSDFVEVDAWCETIETWLASPCADAAAGLTIWEVACGALSIERRNFDRAKETRIGKALRTMGFTRRRVRRGGVLTYLYSRVPTVPT
ncbi:VapE domain-containing protein [Variovorax ureilyticus]|uniref:VapE domain-containing protein n=1 Tax=Variovorax ureilyticus TaxID=1836198 RepID=A0ABU8VCM7_9BURK